MFLGRPRCADASVPSGSDVRTSRRVAGAMSRRVLVVVGAAALAIGSAPSAEAYGGRTSGLITATPCLPVTTSGFDPETGASDCRGTAVLTGSWTGTMRYHVVGHVDPVTGDAVGTINQRWEGWAEGVGGGLYLTGTFDVDGATGIGVSRMRIVAGEGVFHGATGEATFTLYQPLTGGVQTGTYTGSWRVP